MDPNHQRDSALRRRLALYGSLAGIVAAILALTWYLGRGLPGTGDWENVDYSTMPEVELLRRYVRIDTSPTTGSELAGAEFLAAELRKMGLKPTIEQFGDRHANVWAILEGKSREALVLHSHIDVFPVLAPEAWDFDPYGGEIDKAWLYGRGVFDMKSLAVVQLLTLRDIVESGRTPEKTLIFLATGSEEVGSELGTRWVLEQHPELSSRFWAVLTEGGVVEPVSRTEIKYWGIEFGQKRFATTWVCAETREELDAFSRQVFLWRDSVEQLKVTREVARFARAYAPSRDRDSYRSALEDPQETILDLPRFLDLPVYLQSQFRTEIVPFQPEPDPEGGYRMKLIFHLLPGESPEAARARLLPSWLLHELAVSAEPALGATSASPIDHPVFQALLSSVKKAYPGTLVGPYFLPWSATDSRFFRQHGIPSYGFSPFVIFSTDTFRVDGTNERLSLPGYLSGFELYRKAVLRIAG